MSGVMNKAMMYLHVGNNRNIRVRDIIGIFDADNATRSPVSKKYLSESEKRGLVSSAAEELPKSFVLYRTEDGCQICFSPLSPQTLKGRLNGK